MPESFTLAPDAIVAPDHFALAPEDIEDAAVRLVAKFKEVVKTAEHEREHLTVPITDDEFNVSVMRRIIVEGF